MPEPTQAILLAAGQGTRMWPLTETRPKPAIPIAGKPLVARMLDRIREAGIDTVTLVAASDDDAVVTSARRTAKRHEMALNVTVQREQRGTGHALQVAGLPEDEPVLVTYGDLYLKQGALSDLADAVGQAGIGARRVGDVREFGALSVSGDELTGLEEKPDAKREGLVNAGVYVFPPGFARHVERLEESPRGELELTDAIQASLDEGQRFDVHAFEAWHDLGWPWEILRANRAALDAMKPRISGEVHESVTIEGPVHIARDARVRAGCVIEGPVMVRRGATVGPNAYVRAGTTVGRDAKVGNGCEVKNSVLFPGAKVPHLSYVGDSVLGADVNLGAGTQVANLRHDGANVLVETPRGRKGSGRRKLGVVLGDGVKTGINATLNVGVMLGPGAMVGPGETVKESRLPQAEGQ